MRGNKTIILLKSKEIYWHAVETTATEWIKLYKKTSPRATEVRLKVLNDDELVVFLRELTHESWKPGGPIYLTIIDNVIDPGAIAASMALMNMSRVKLRVHVYNLLIAERLRFGLLKEKYKKIDVKFFASSNYLARGVKKVLRGARVSVVPLPIPENFFSQKASPAKAEKIKIVYVGRLIPEKGVLLLLKWWEHFADLKPGAELHLIGSETSHLEQRLPSQPSDRMAKQALIRDLIRRNKKSINVTKWTDRKDLPRLLKDMNLFVSLSRFEHEGYGLAVAEALALGVPALLSAWQGHLEFKDSRFASVISIEVIMNAKARDLLTRKVLMVVNRSLSDRKKANTKQREWARKKFSRSIIAKKLFASFW